MVDQMFEFHSRTEFHDDDVTGVKGSRLMLAFPLPWLSSDLSWPFYWNSQLCAEIIHFK